MKKKNERGHSGILFNLYMSYKNTLSVYLNTVFTVSIFDEKLFASKHKSVSVFKIVRPQIDCRTIGRFFGRNEHVVLL